MLSQPTKTLAKPLAAAELAASSRRLGISENKLRAPKAALPPSLNPARTPAPGVSFKSLNSMEDLRSLAIACDRG